MCTFWKANRNSHKKWQQLRKNWEVCFCWLCHKRDFSILSLLPESHSGGGQQKGGGDANAKSPSLYWENNKNLNYKYTRIPIVVPNKHIQIKTNPVHIEPALPTMGWCDVWARAEI
jgi:hypothetical protein